MALSKPSNDSYFDAVRGKLVKKTPEERVRQGLLIKMMSELGYPKALLAVEKELSSLPHLAHVSPAHLPKRRIDIVVFAKDLHPQFALFPLLTIECKAIRLSPKIAEQVVSYNETVKAPFIALANEFQEWIGHFDAGSGRYVFAEGLPAYQTLISLMQNRQIPA